MKAGQRPEVRTRDDDSQRKKTVIKQRGQDRGDNKEELSRPAGKWTDIAEGHSLYMHEKRMQLTSAEQLQGSRDSAD
jgi:hypothetical protein